MAASEHRISNCLFFVSSSQEIKEELIEKPKPPISELTRRMVEGNEEAWVTFHNEYSPRLFRYLLVSLRGDEHLAAELLQITLIRIARHIREFNDEPVLWHWCARIARTVTIDELRRRGRQVAFMGEMEEARETSLADQKWDELLNLGLKRMPVEEVELLSRKYLEGWSVRNISGELGLTEKAVESKLVRARQKLREIMLGLLTKDE